MNTNQTLPEKAIIPNNTQEKPNQHKDNEKDNVQNDKKIEGSAPQKASMIDKPFNKEKNQDSIVPVKSLTNNKDNKKDASDPKLTHPHRDKDHKA
ncbi:MAG: hypothetical protein K2X04_12170 [Burkholderiales bacterium]|nr:hypothetical protein [Burkholderiales bacterium]